MREAVIVSYARTAIGRAKKGSLKDTRPEEFAAPVLKALLARTPGLAAAAIDDVDARHIGQHVGELVKALLLDLGAADGSNVQRNVLNTFGPARGGHGDGLRTQLIAGWRGGIGILRGSGKGKAACQRNQAHMFLE